MLAGSMSSRLASARARISANAIAALVICGFASAAQSQLALAPAAPARACEHRDVILDATDFLLMQPQNPPRFWRDHQAADAAYLRIRYNNSTYEESRALIDSLASRPRLPERLLDLRLTYARPSDRAALLAAQSADASGSPLAEVGESALRALVVEDGGDWLIKEMARWRGVNPAAFDRSPVSLRLANAIDDVEDTAKERLAQRFEEAGLLTPAMLVAERMSRLHLYIGVLQRRGSTPSDLRDSLRRPLSIARTRPLNMAEQPDDVRSVAMTMTSKRIIDPLYELVRRTSHGAILATVLNQQGEPRIATELAVNLVKEIDAGRLDPVHAPDAILQAMADGLDRLIGKAERERQLKSFQVHRQGVEAANALSVIDAAVARLALAPVIAGAAPDVARPPLLSAEFDWDLWKRIANALRVGTDSYGADERLIASDLLQAANRWPEALAVLKAERDWQAARQAAYRLMVALDARCARDLSHPVPFSDPLYRFDQR